jgi:hypothetical protein
MAPKPNSQPAIANDDQMLDKITAGMDRVTAAILEEYYLGYRNMGKSMSQAAQYAIRDYMNDGFDIENAARRG